MFLLLCFFLFVFDTFLLSFFLSWHFFGSRWSSGSVSGDSQSVVTPFSFLFCKVDFSHRCTMCRVYCIVSLLFESARNDNRYHWLHPEQPFGENGDTRDASMMTYGSAWRNFCFISLIQFVNLVDDGLYLFVLVQFPPSESAMLLRAPRISPLWSLEHRRLDHLNRTQLIFWLQFRNILNCLTLSHVCFHKYLRLLNRNDDNLTNPSWMLIAQGVSQQFI